MMMKCLAMVGIILLALVSALAAELDSKTRSEITQAVENELKEKNVPGAELAIVRDGEVVYEKAFGVRSLEDPMSVQTDTLFRLGSTTKMLTSLVALEAAARGELDLDKPVATYLRDIDPGLGKVTMRQLLSHTAGMREASPSLVSNDDDALSEMVRSWKSDYQFAPAGEVFSYSGPGYWIAGAVLEKVTGKSYPELMKERLFGPVGMERSTLRPLQALTFPFSQGHEMSNDKLVVVRPMAENVAMYCSGSVFSSAKELAQLAVALLSGGMLNGNRVLPEQAVKNFFTAQTKLPGDYDAQYGFGLVNFAISGTQVFEHGGVRRGYGSHIRFMPEKRGAVILMTNKNGETLRQSLATITKVVFGLEETEPEKKTYPAMTPEQARRYAGLYVHADIAKYTVTMEGAQLYVEGDKREPLTQTGKDTFQTPGGAEYAFVFVPGMERAKYIHTDLLSLIRKE